MKRIGRKYILILLMFLTTLLCAVGSSTWIILSEKKVNAPTFEKVDTYIEITDAITVDYTNITRPNETKAYSDSNKKIYSGETPTFTGYTLKDADGDVVTNCFDLESNVATLTASGTSDSLTANADVWFEVKDSFAQFYNNPTITVNNEVKTTVPVEVSFYSVATFGSTNYYSTIDGALDAAYKSTSSSGTITSLPLGHDLETGRAKNAKTIKTATEIKTGYTLKLPYTTSKVTDYFNTSNDYGSDYIRGIAKDTSASYTNSNNKSVPYYPAAERSTSAYRNNPTKYLKNNVTIKSSHTLTNNGTIEIGGVISGGNGGQALNCYTIVDYAQITLQASSKLKSNGTITNYGFIVNEGTYTANQKPQLLLEKGTLTAPFTLVEHRGGTIFGGVFFAGGGTSSGATSNPIGLPFNRFYMENVCVETKITSNAQVVSYVNLWASSLLGNTHESTFLLIGNTSSDAFIKLNDGSYIISNFSSTEVKDYLDFYGDFTIDSMALSVVGRNISSSNSHFPISNHYSITLNKNPESTKNAKVTFNQKIKIMQGGSLTVNQGVDLTANEIIVYTTNCFDKTAAAAANYKYPTELANGKFIVNGSLTTSNNMGGIIQTTSDNATLILSGSNSVTAQELVSGSVNSKLYPTSGEAVFLPVSKTLSLSLIDGKTSSNTGTYYSKGGKWYSNQPTITFKYQDGATADTSKTVTMSQAGGYTITKADLPTPTRAHYKFDGWYTNSGCTISAVGQTIYNSTTLYAKWTPITYKIIYNVTYEEGITPIEISDSTFTVGNTVNLTKPTISGKNFFGWYSDTGMTKPITSVSTNLIDNKTVTFDETTKTITVYGKFVNSYIVNFYVNNSEIAGKLGYSQYLHDDYAAPNVAYDNVPNATTYDEDKTVTVYFAGWYLDSACTQAWDSTNPITANTNIYAKWTNKHVLSFNTTTDCGNVQVTAPTSVYLIDDQTHDLSGYNSTMTANDLLMNKTKYFGGWYNGETLVTSITITGDTTLTAKWLDKTVVQFLTGAQQSAFTNETYYLFDGQSISTSQTVQDAITAFNNNTQNTKIFDGWTDGTTDYEDVVVTAYSTANKTFTAQWKSKLEIKFIDNARIFTSETHYPTEEQLPFSTPTDTIKTAIETQNADTNKLKYFRGWSIDGGSTIYDESIVVSTSESVTFTAVWGNKHLVTIKDVIENNAKATKTYYIIPGNTFTLASDFITNTTNYSNDTTKTEYFAGWNGAEDQVKEISVTVNSALTYTANWQTKHVITVIGVVEGDSNSVTKVYNIIPNAPFELLNTFVDAIDNYSTNTDKSQYFAGWNDATDQDANISIIAVTASATYTANWQNKYALTLTGSSGANKNAITVNEVKYLHETQLPYTELTSSFTTKENITVNAYDSNPTVNKYFYNWTIDTTAISADGITASDFTDKKLTVTANWAAKVTVTVDYAGAKDYTNIDGEYYKPETDYTVPTKLEKTGYTFTGWTASVGTVEDGTITLPATDGATVALTANYEKRAISVTINVSKSSNMTYSITAGSTTINSGDQSNKTCTVYIGDTISFTHKKKDGYKDSSATFEVNGTTQNTTNYPVAGDETSITLTITGGDEDSGCFAAGTLITLADGTHKKIEDLNASDSIMVFNHETGQITSINNVFIIKKDRTTYPLLKLYFENGITFDILFEHGIFDCNTNQYEILTPENIQSYVGHYFYAYRNNQSEKVKLLSYTLDTIETECYSLMSPIYINHFANDLLCVSDGIKGLYNIFELDENMTINQGKKQADIEKYGLSQYDDWKEYFTYEQFIAFNVQYYYVIMGKGLCTDEDILFYIEKYLSQFM